jgi:hypothetical protein
MASAHQQPQRVLLSQLVKEVEEDDDDDEMTRSFITNLTAKQQNAAGASGPSLASEMVAERTSLSSRADVNGVTEAPLTSRFPTNTPAGIASSVVSSASSVASSISSYLPSMPSLSSFSALPAYLPAGVASAFSSTPSAPALAPAPTSSSPVPSTSGGSLARKPTSSSSPSLSSAAASAATTTSSSSASPPRLRTARTDQGSPGSHKSQSSTSVAQQGGNVRSSPDYSSQQAHEAQQQQQRSSPVDSSRTQQRAQRAASQPHLSEEKPSVAVGTVSEGRLRKAAGSAGSGLPDASPESTRDCNDIDDDANSGYLENDDEENVMDSTQSNKDGFQVFGSTHYSPEVERERKEIDRFVPLALKRKQEEFPHGIKTLHGKRYLLRCVVKTRSGALILQTVLFLRKSLAPGPFL